MARILFGSIVRDGKAYLPRYFKQLESLTNKHEIGLFICEGDSVDGTFEYLQNVKPNFYPYHVYKFDHKGEKFGSVNNPIRWQNIAATWNYMLDRIHTIDSYDYFCYMEADLIWDSKTIDQLVWDCDYFDAVAPMSMLGDMFYDTWGHRAFGENFTNMYPYHSCFHRYEKYMPLQSAGSCIMMQSKVAKVCRLNPTDAMIGHDIIRNKFTFVLNKLISVHHP